METEKGKFYIPIRVRFVETDLQGHVFFGNYLTYFDEALTEYMQAVGYTYKDFYSDGVDFFYIHSECDYKARAYFQDVLHVYARLPRIGNSSIPFEFVAVNSASGEEIATGKIVAVTVERESKRPTRVPDGFREAVAHFEGYAK